MRTYYIFTLGCQMNIADSQKITTILDSLGYKSASEYEADLIVINACSVRQKAVDRIWGGIKKWQKSDKKIILTGCVLPADRKKFAQKGIRFFPIQNLFDLKKLKKSQDKHSNIPCLAGRQVQNIGGSINNYFEIKPKFKIKSKHEKDNDIAYVPIMTGCDNFCSYCAVPLTRGREKSRPIKDVVSDAKRALKNGSKEILLLGQNVNSYGIKKLRSSTNYLKNSGKFIKLLKTIDSLPGKFTFNFISSNPDDMSDGLIKTLAKLKKWPRELHLPLQSGDDTILRKMNRKYTSNQYLVLVKNLKSQISNLKISTDIIVGFPAETKKQYDNTVKFCRKIKFKKAYISQYSPRPGTAAAKLDDDVPALEKKRRWNKLDKFINHTHNQ